MVQAVVKKDGFTGRFGGVDFEAGEASVDLAQAALDVFGACGFEVELTPIDEADEVIGLESMTVEQLKSFAAENEYTLGDASKKAEIIEAITSQIPTVEGTPAE